MKKSTSVPASLILGLAASWTTQGCGGGYRNECRDNSGRVLPDSACRGGVGYLPGAHWVRVSTGGFGSSGGYYGG